MKIWILTEQNPDPLNAVRGNGEVISVWDNINGFVDVTAENQASILDGATAFLTADDANEADGAQQAAAPLRNIELVQVERTTTLLAGYSLVA